MSRIAAALLERRRRALVLFTLAELTLALAIPFVLIQGYHTLLDSQTGTFIEEPTRSEPGWAALVDPTDVIGIAEVDRGIVTGVALVVHNPEQSSVGSVVLVPGTLDLGGSLLADRDPTDAVLAVSEALRLGVARVEVLDEQGWAAFLGLSRYELESPDPVPDGAGGVLLPVGPVDVGAAEASAFVGRPAGDAVAVSVLPRRRLLWEAVLAQPPESGSSLATDLAAVDGAASRVIDLPVTQLEPVAVLDATGAELLIRDVVAFPAGALAGDRLRVRIVDRTGLARLEDIAAAVAAEGLEVIEIANATAFDDGPSQVIAPVTLVGPGGQLSAGLAELAQSIGLVDVTIDPEPVDEFVVTVVIGADFDEVAIG